MAGARACLSNTPSRPTAAQVGAIRSYGNVLAYVTDFAGKWCVGKGVEGGRVASRECC